MSSDADFLKRLVNVLNSASSPSNEIQQQVIKAIDEMALFAEFGPSLAYILTHQNMGTVELRQRAGLLLKAHIVRENVTLPSVPLRDIIMQSLADPEPIVRKTGGSIITALVMANRSAGSSDILRALASTLDGPSPLLADGAFDALLKISEDVIDLWRQRSLGGELDGSHKLENDRLVDDFITFSTDEFLPRIFSLTNPTQKMRLLNTFALNFLFFPNHPLQKYLSSYFRVLGELAMTDAEPDVTAMVCKGLVYIAQHHPDLYETSLPVVIRFLLASSRHTVYRIRLEALQFWPIAIVNGDWLPMVQTVIPDLLPILLDNMIYSQEDFLNMDEGLLVDDDATVPDRAEDMAPRFHKESSDDVEDICEDEDDESGPLSTWGSEWTVRKSAASALDHMATAFRDSILPFVLPLIEAKLRSEEWEIQECALLALGAIGHGCMQGLSPHLPAILQLLESISKSRKPLLRSISCWTISRFAAWISFDTHRGVALPLSLSVILVRMLDQNKRVQEAAVSAFVSLEEEVGMYLEEYLPDIIKTICRGLSYYQSKNLLILLDAVACLFEAMGPETMSKPEIIQVLIPPIISSFRRVHFASEKQLSLSLFECLTAICTNVGPSVGLDALEFIIRKCTAVLEANIVAYRQITGHMSREEKPDSDILACALDLLCGVLDGLADAAPNVVMKVNFIPFVCQLVSQFEHESKLPLVRNYYSNTVRQCAFALVGDVAKTCSVVIDEDNLRAIMPVLIAYVSIGPMSVSNNASWAIGEISMRRGLYFIEPFVDSISLALLNNLKRFDAGTRPIVRQNAAIALGRLGLVASARMISSGIFPEMFDPWCVVIKKLRTDGEKLTAVKGFTLCLEASPRTALTKERLTLLFEMIASMFPPPATVEMSLKNMILIYRQMLGENDWASLWSSFPIEIQYRINQGYALGMAVAHSAHTGPTDAPSS